MTVNAWESVFTQSKANDGYYDKDGLPVCRWDWPKGTWFQARLDYIRERHLKPMPLSAQRDLRGGQSPAGM